MNEIAERLRNWRLVHLTQLRYLMETASDEIERLQALADKRGELAVERRIAEMRLTDEERGAIEWFVGFGADRPSKAVNITRTLMDRRRDGAAASTLRALLERL